MKLHRTRPEHPTALAVGMLLVVLPSLVTGASADTIEESRAERKQVQESIASTAAQVDVAQADVDVVAEALEKVGTGVDTQEAALADAERAMHDAEANRMDAIAAVEALRADLEATRVELREAAVEAYVSFQLSGTTASLLASDPWQNAREEALTQIVTGNRFDSLDELRRIGADLERQLRLADDAALEAEAGRAAADEHLAALETAREREAVLADAAEERLDKLLYEMESLRALDADLAARIQRETKRLAEALARRRAKEAADAAARTLPPDADIELVSVGGIVVNAAIAADTKGLLAAMAAEGFELGGGGYRSHQAQISLRRAHCGTSEHAIWHVSATKCRPPTARPGRSDHERGLAIDFTYNGRIISSRSSAVFLALQRIAPGFGFVNLPSEPWHWSKG